MCVAAKKFLDPGETCELRNDRRLAGHVVSRDVGRGQRRAHNQGRGAHRLRSRLPRRHLRHLLARDQRQAAWSASRRGDLPDVHAQFQRRRRDHR